MILEAIVPAYLKHLQTSAGRKDPRTERDILHQLGVAMKTLITNAEALTKLLFHLYWYIILLSKMILMTVGIIPARNGRLKSRPVRNRRPTGRRH